MVRPNVVRQLDLASFPAGLAHSLALYLDGMAVAMSLVMTGTGGLCGTLDIGDERALISTDALSADDVVAALHRAVTATAFDGPRADVSDDSVVRGPRTVAKAQHRAHERFATITWFDEVRTGASIPAPRLLDCGTVKRPSGDVWWAVLERVNGAETTTPTAARQRAIGAALRRWHETAPVHGLRLDEDGGLGVYLGTPRRHLKPEGYVALGAALSEACAGLPMAPIHGDVAVCHNAFFDDDELTAMIDPGAVHVGPPMLDLAWCLAIDMARGSTDGSALLTGYGTDAVDDDVLDALLPIAQLRYLVDLVEDRPAFTRLADVLVRRAPRLVDSTGVLTSTTWYHSGS